jgi:lipoate-protein ligase A
MVEHETWRLLEDGERECRRHFAVEESVLREVDAGASPGTLRLRRAEPSVWIGVFQRANEDVDLDACRELGVPLVRRYNPGGAVYQDDGTFCYSAFFRKDEFFAGRGLRRSSDLYVLTARAVVETCAHFGVVAEPTGVNDVSINGRKVCGAAQVEQGAAFVHSGTFLVSADRDRMQRLLRPSMLKLADKGFTTIKDRVVNLTEAVGRPLAVADVMAVLSDRLAAALGIRLDAGRLTAREGALADELLRSKYGREEWNTPQGACFETSVARKVPSGVVLLAASWRGGALERIEVHGDFLLPNPLELGRVTTALTGRTLDEARALVNESAITGELKRVIAELLAESRPLQPRDVRHGR